jgi:hypothetical protein
VRADRIEVGAGWAVFFWDQGTGAFNSEGPLTFRSASPVVVKVTDAFLVGDRFEVYDNNVLLGATSRPVADGTNILGDADAAFANPKFSRGAFRLGAGSHSLTVKLIEAAPGFSAGAGFLRVDSVPEPGALALAALGAVAALGSCWRRQPAPRKG